MKAISPRAFFFDFDGVIVDTERLHMLCALEVAAKRGLTFTEEEYFRKYVGFDDFKLFREIWSDRGNSLAEKDLDTMMGEKNALIMRRLTEKVVFYDGAIAFIKQLSKAGIPLAVVSGSLKDEIILGLKQGGLAKFFSVIVSADMVNSGKPDPESYELAWEMMLDTVPDLEKTDCWVLEDSPAGISAGKDAGLNVIGITNSVPETHLARADVIVKHVDDIKISG